MVFHAFFPFRLTSATDPPGNRCRIGAGTSMSGSHSFPCLSRHTEERKRAASAGALEAEAASVRSRLRSYSVAQQEQQLYTYQY
mmetsp:Transcript_28063/g.56900  ORF Transcript_28063/g.56900 Transcript_28063/m.56900 type:complete len:84 (+) Transcript_28063:22-273(+)